MGKEAFYVISECVFKGENAALLIHQLTWKHKVTRRLHNIICDGGLENRYAFRLPTQEDIDSSLLESFTENDGIHFGVHGDDD